MNREKAFAALGELDDKLIAEAIRYAPGEAAGSPARIRPVKKRILTLALAAVLLLALSITAYAAFSAMSHRIPDPEETFRISFKGRETMKINSYRTGLDFVLKKIEESGNKT